MKEYEAEGNSKVGFLQVLDENTPIKGINLQIPDGAIIDKLNTDISNARKSGKSYDEKVQDLFDALNMTMSNGTKLKGRPGVRVAVLFGLGQGNRELQLPCATE